MTTVRALRQGESTLGVSCGGPVARLNAVDAPIPYAVARYAYGLNDRFGVNVADHLLLLAFGRIGLDGGLTCRLVRQQGWIPECGIGAGLTLLTGLRSDSRLFPSVTASASYLFRDRFLTYLGAQGMFQFGRPPAFVWAPVLGEQVKLSRRISVALESKWYAPSERNAPREVQYLLPIANRGALGFVLGVSYAFGK